MNASNAVITFFSFQDVHIYAIIFLHTTSKLDLHEALDALFSTFLI